MRSLNIGCGSKVIPGFTNLDFYSGNGVDVVADASLPLPFPDNSFDLVYASHILEHFHRDQTVDVLKMWSRVLAPGGTMRIAVPDFQKCVWWYINRNDIWSIQGLVCGGHKFSTHDAHKALFDHKKLKECMESAGFVDVREYDWRKTEHAQYDDFSQAYLPHMDKEEGLLMSLNMEGRKQ